MVTLEIKVSNMYASFHRKVGFQFQFAAFMPTSPKKRGGGQRVEELPIVGEPKAPLCKGGCHFAPQSVK